MLEQIREYAETAREARNLSGQASICAASSRWNSRRFDSSFAPMANLSTGSYRRNALVRSLLITGNSTGSG